MEKIIKSLLIIVLCGVVVFFIYFIIRIQGTNTDFESRIDLLESKVTNLEGLKDDKSLSDLEQRVTDNESSIGVLESKVKTLQKGIEVVEP